MSKHIITENEFVVCPYCNKQAKVLHELSVQRDLSQEKVMVQALKVYQLYLTGNLIRVRKTKLQNNGTID